MTIPNSVLERLRNNEIVARKFHEIEISILNILNFQDFIEQLLTEISTKFSVPFAWLSIIEESPIAAHIEGIRTSKLIRNSTAFISEEAFIAITKNRLRPILADTSLEKFNALIPETSDYLIGSIAVAPITFDGKIVGSFNQADENPERFKPGIDTSLLERLALKVSLCLSNVTAHEQLKFLAFHDPLTQLLNRGVMERILEREFQRSTRYHIDLSVIFLDLDDFKLINDTFGHDNGDRALVHTANCLSRLKRDSDIVARFAGDEFVVILPSTTKAQAEYYIQRVRDELDNSPLQANSLEFYVKLSYGISSAFDKEIDTSAKLLKAADKHLYKAKQHKKSNR